MPRKTKDQEELNKEVIVEKKEPSKKKNTKKTESTTAKKTAVKKAATKKTSTKKASTTTTKKTTTKKSTTAKKTTTKKASATKKTATKKSTTTKKAINKKSSTSKKTSSTKRATKSKTKKVDIVEYYDLPYRYNQTVVKILAQTPTTLFIYWDISDTDRKNLEKAFGEDFFWITKPVLIVHNDTLNYSFEVEINDFANSWYLQVADSKCDYRIELGRRPIQDIKNPENPSEVKVINNDYIYITMSNEIESPNDKVLIDNLQEMVSFRNVKTGVETKKSISSIIKNMSKIYNIYDLYKAIYHDENIEDIYDLSNPSSGNPSSSSRFK